MAPILTTAVGILPQPLSAPLRKLLMDLKSVTAENVQSVLADAGDSYFNEEQVDLHLWIEPINNLDQILRSTIEKYPQIFLLPPVPRMSKMIKPPDVKPAQTLDEAISVPLDIIQRILAILSFWEALLRNSTAKSVFNSVEECCDLLASGNDEIVDAALSMLQALALPPALHKQQAPELHGHGTALQNAHPICLSRVTAMARGYTSRATGLGLYQLLTTQQPIRPVQFSYYRRDKDEDAMEIDTREQEECLHEIVLNEHEIVVGPSTATEGSSTKKRRRVTAPVAALTTSSTDDDLSQPTRSTSELFFLALSKAKGNIHPERLFSLLADIRWARSKTQAAVNRRLSALICILHSHPSPDVMSGYFVAQPELVVEIVDLLRPTVSANAVSSAAAALHVPHSNGLQQDGITWLADTQEIPFRTRMLALEALAALVARRDGPSCVLTGATRVSSVLAELGVGKGQYLGLLPTLIRYSLASLGNALVEDDSSEVDSVTGSETDSPVVNSSLQLGLAFVEATLPVRPSRVVQVKQALEVIDSVLTLTSAVVAVPSGASSLIECGMIPAMLTTIAADTNASCILTLKDETDVSDSDLLHIKALLRFIAAQAVQILEGAVVTSSSALTAFHDLNGVDSLTSRLTREISLIPQLTTDIPNKGGDVMEVDQTMDMPLGKLTSNDGHEAMPRLTPSQRVLLYSIVTCLTVVFHQESSISNVTPSGATQLKKPEMTVALVRIIDEVSSFGGHLASLVATLLADVMNNDPLVVHYVHESGIAESFLDMITGRKVGDLYEPTMPPVAELIMAVPNVLAALALTEDGAKVVKDAAPFPGLMRIFYHPTFAMPVSRCLLNEMTSVFGTGLDEIMRHVAQLKSDILLSIVNGMEDVLKMATDLVERERLRQDERQDECGLQVTGEEEAIETERTCLIQYVMNFAQLLEQILHNEDHCEPFVDAGGLDALLQLFPASMPGGAQLLTHLSTLSSLSVGTVHHSTIGDSLLLAIKCIQFRYDPLTMVRKVLETTQSQLACVEASHKALFHTDSLHFSLDHIQRMPFYKQEATSVKAKEQLAEFLRNVALLQWTTSILTSTIKSMCQRSQESGSDAWNATERVWKIELSSESFTQVFDRLAHFYNASLFEVCRVRTEDGFEASERERLTMRTQNVVYKLRIVCPEGAVVRDGIEIDSCASVGSMEMGEIVTAYDRCINSSGIMRWRTSRGWISEMTRGHGREPIAEVISVSEGLEDMKAVDEVADPTRTEAAIPDLRVVSLGLLARGQTLYSQLFVELSKLSIHVIRSVPVRTMSFEAGSAAGHVAGVLRMLSASFMNGLNADEVRRCINTDYDADDQTSISVPGLTMYFGTLISQIQLSLFDERRERSLVNLPLLVDLIGADPFAKMLVHETLEDDNSLNCLSERVGILGACAFVIHRGMYVLQKHTNADVSAGDPQWGPRTQRSIAASFPPLVSLLRRLISTPISSSPVSSVLSRIKWKDLPKLVGRTELDPCFIASSANDGFFEPERFVKLLHLGISRLMRRAWQDQNMVYVPSHLMFPLVNVISDLIEELAEASNEKSSSSSRESRNESGFSLSAYLRRRREPEEPLEAAERQHFEPDESAIALLVDMGFSRDRAVDAFEATRSSRVEIAMEYALTHPPPSPATIERRRIEREERSAGLSDDAAHSSDAAADGVVNAAHNDDAAADGVVNAAHNDDAANEDVVNATQDTESVAMAEAAGNNAEIIASEALNSDNTAAGIVNDTDVYKSKSEIAAWLRILPVVICELLACIGCTKAVTKGVSKCDGETEAFTAVISTLLLQISNRFPDESHSLLPGIFERLRKELTGSMVLSDKESAIAALCQAAAIVTRAIPKARVLVLQNSLLNPLIAAVKSSYGQKISDTHPPKWLAPAILLVEVMAQPVAGFADEEFSKAILNGASPIIGSELQQVQNEHRTLLMTLGKACEGLFSALYLEKTDSANDRSKLSDASGLPVDDTSSLAKDTLIKPEDAILKERPSPDSTVPGYFPLVPLVLLEECREVCIELLSVASVTERKVHPTPNVAHATLLLLLRLIRTPKASDSCRQAGAVECILSLPAASKFAGHSSLVALVFRRLIEDSSTLQSAMEFELRGILARLQAGHPGTTGHSAQVSLRAFVEAATPMLCREPLSFIKAMALTVKVNSGPKGGAFVTLLSNEERARHQAIIGSLLFTEASVATDVSSIQPNLDLRGRPSSQKKEKDRRSSSIGRKIAKETLVGAKTGGRASHNAPESPASFVMSLLMNSIIGSSVVGEPYSAEEEFLWTGSRLEIIAELILAIPACASAVHNYRPNRTKDKAARAALTSRFQHAMQGCPSPPKTFVSFLLHVVLPQDRSSIRSDSELWDKRKGRDEEEVQAIRKRRAVVYCITKSSQAAARVLLALATRPGEGRKRVIADLVFALSGGRFGHGSVCSGVAIDANHFSEHELFALQAWAEITVGMYAPRSIGRTTDGMGSLSIENIRLLLDAGAGHALMYAIHRVKLFHPWASATVAALLQPLDCLTRSSISESVQTLIQREKAKENNHGTVHIDSKARPLLTNDTFDNGMDASDVAAAQRDVEMIDPADGESVGDGNSSNNSSSSSHSHSSDDDGGNSDNSDMEEDSVDEDDEDEVDGEDLDSSASDEDEDVELDEEGDWDDGEQGGFLVDQDEIQEEADLAVEESLGLVGQPVEDGWTRVEASAFGGLGGRRDFASAGTSDRARMRGFVDAAEAMIGSLLRNGEISNEAMDEIGETLGIQMASHGRSFQSMLAGRDLRLVSATGAQGQRTIRVLGDGEAGTQRLRGEVATAMPQIHQQSQPDISYSALSGGRRRNEISSMEYVFGGPTVSSGSRNFSLIPSVDEQLDDSPQQSLSLLDLQLFPDGPASAAMSRLRYNVHPLVAGVDLPPMNSLVSDLPSDGTRGARMEDSVARQPGAWANASPGGLLMSTTNGNIVRSFARPHSSSAGAASAGPRAASSATGLAEDGVITDATLDSFTSALERSLAHSVHSASEASPNEDAEPEDQHVSDEGQAADLERGSTDSIPSDGEIVASSLVEGLRLSPGIDLDVRMSAQSGTGEHQEDEQLVAGASHVQAIASNEIMRNEPQSSVGETLNQQTRDTIESNEEAQPMNTDTASAPDPTNLTDDDGLVCPPDVDLEVFNSLPLDMQRECVHQYNSTRELAEQVSGSTLDPDVLAALPEEMRREVIEQERQERLMREQAQAPADPSHAEEMDNASFIASLAPELRAEILTTADDAFLNSLPPSFIAEAQLLRERASMQHQRIYEDGADPDEAAANGAVRVNDRRSQVAEQASSRKHKRIGKIKIETDKIGVIYRPESMSRPFGKSDIMMLVRLMYLVSPVRPSRLLQKVFHNLFADPLLRSSTTKAFIRLLCGDLEGSRLALGPITQDYSGVDDWRSQMDAWFADSNFPPLRLIGSVPDATDSELSITTSKRKSWPTASASIAANLPKFTGTDSGIPPVVSTRLVDTMLQLCKASPRFCVHLLGAPSDDTGTGFEQLLDLLGRPAFNRSSANLDQLLSLLEATVAPLSQIPKLGDEDIEISQKELNAAAASGKRWVEIPRITVSKSRLQLLCSILRMEECRESSFSKVNTIVRRLCRVETNRSFVLGELASVGHALGSDARRDLRALKVRMESAANQYQTKLKGSADAVGSSGTTTVLRSKAGHIASSITLSISSSELKLLRVLQTLQSLCGENWDESGSKKNDSIVVTDELIHLLKQLDFSQLWDELSSCLGVVQVLEGVKAFEEEERSISEDMEVEDETEGERGANPHESQRKKLRNSAAGLLTRFLPSVEAFFVANASAAREQTKSSGESGANGNAHGIDLERLVDGKRVIAFVATNKVLLNALVRNNSSLIDKGLRALVQVPRCRPFLDFDVKRQWFKNQLRRLRQQASRRHGSLRLHIRRKYVFEDAYHQLRLRNAEEMRGRLHVTFRNEEGVDAGGLSREFFGILAKEIFNPNYALFTSTEDGCTFQPNPNSSINPDHLSYFRFVGRIVGKAVADGFLLDAHFTRSLYKHMLGMTPSYHDMEAIDPDYYRNLKIILEFSLADIGLDLTFSIEDHSFGRNQTIDLIPNGRNTHVTDEDKEEYVRLVCQHRMTTAIQSQIKAYLDGFYEMVNPELIVIFTPRELELLISGLPEIDVADLKANTEYVGYKATDNEIVWFWSIVSNLSRNEKASFLQFVTGSSKVPLSGFGELQGMRGIQKFSIHKVSGKKGALMSAHTCFNQLDLPTYDSEEEMRTKLLLAINEGGGAFLFA